MAISQRLKEIYSNYEEQTLYYEAIELSHPQFNFGIELYPSNSLYPADVLYPDVVKYGTSIFLIQSNDGREFNVDGNNTTFLPYPFGLVPPEVGSDSQNIQIVFDNVSRTIIDGIEKAMLQPEVPIKARYFIFVEGEADSQITPLTLTLTNIRADIKSIQATAQRADLYKYYFGTKIYDTRFKGLML